MIRRKPKQTDGGHARLDISSLIDVSFLLLIYFLVTSTLDPREGDIEMTLPTPGVNHVTVDLDFPKVFVNSAGTVLMGDDVLDTDIDSRTLAMLEDRLRTYVEAHQIFGSSAGPTVELDVDDSVEGQRFIDVLNCFAGVGISDVRLVGFHNE
tara:strand:+ start:3640 stop:4095 length:456 start_codon:yes stop_codon:yes gene_type:complete